MSVLFLAVGCGLMDFEIPDLNPLDNTPTPLPTPTPVGDTLAFRVVGFSAELTPGDSVERSGLKFISRSNEIFTVGVAGQVVEKRSGNSFFWQGIIAPGIFATYDLNIGSAADVNNMVVGGEVTYEILNPNPVSTPIEVCESYDLCHNNITVEYTVPRNVQVPGTTLIYSGTLNGRAGFNTSTGQISYALNDNLFSRVKLRDNMYASHTLEIVEFSDATVRVQGNAEIFIRGR